MVNAEVAALKDAVNKALGSTVLTLGSDERFIVKYIPTGLVPFDIMLRGGFPRGRMTMIQGDWSTLKSYAGYCAIRETQLAGGTAALIDNEHAFDPEWAEDIGINNEDLILIHASTGEEALDAAEALVRGGVDLIVFDSVSAALPQSEAKKRLHKEENQPGRQAALFSLACRKLTTANSGRTALVWISQLRENIGITFGPREKATGGRALPFYSSYIIDVRKAGKVNREDKMFTGDKWENRNTQIGQTFKAELIKSKLNKPNRSVWFTWSLIDSEVDLASYLFNEGLTSGVLVQKGATYYYGKVKIAVGKDKAKAKIKTDDALRHDLTDDLYKQAGMGTLHAALSPVKKKPSKATKKAPGKKSLSGGSKSLRKAG